MPSGVLIAATIFGGLGLFFFALQFLGENLKLLAGQRLRQRIAKLTATPASGLLVGSIMILTTQSGAASVFILVGLVRAGMMTLMQTQPVILGISVGAGLIVLFLTINIQIAILLLIGMSGVLYAYGKPSIVRLAGATVGIGLLFLGLQIMRQGASGLEQQSWFLSAIEMTQGQPFLSFTIGALLSILAQSSVAVVVVMITFQKAGLFGLEEAIMFVYGANVGSSILTYFLAAKLTGVARQVAYYLVGFNFISALLLVPLFFVEIWFDLPLVATLVEALSSNASTQSAIVYLVFNLAPVPLLLLALKPTARILEKISPETAVEEASKPKYLADKLPSEPAVAQQLIELEQVRLFGLLISGLNAMRVSHGERQRDEALDAFDSLSNAIEAAIHQLTSQPNMTSESFEHLDGVLKIQRSLDAARTAIQGLGTEIFYLRKNAPDLSFPDAVVEGLDTILHILADVARNRQQEDIDIVLRMTSDEGNGTKSVRTAYLAGEDRVGDGDRLHLLAAANYCERLIWLSAETCKSYQNLRSA